MNNCITTPQNSIRELTTRERLVNKKVRLEEDLRKVNDALEAIERNPDIMIICDAIQTGLY